MLVEHSTLYKRYLKEDLRLIYIIEFDKFKIVGFSFMGQDFYYKELYYSLNAENIKRFVPISFEFKLTNILELQECYMNLHYCDKFVADVYSCVNPGKMNSVFLRDLNFKPIVFENYCIITIEGIIVISESMIININDDYFALFMNKPEYMEES